MRSGEMAMKAARQMIAGPSILAFPPSREKARARDGASRFLRRPYPLFT